MRIAATAYRRRRGMLLPIVLIGLLLATLIGAAIARSLITQSQHARRLELQQQVFWLAESGMQRARRQLADDAKYEGEELKIESDASGLASAGVITISVQDASDPDEGRLLVVEAAYPADARLPVISRRELIVEVTSNQPTN